MKIQLQQLTGHLKRSSIPIFLVSGDEFLLVQEACDIIRKHATDKGYKDRKVFHVENGFNWENFVSSTNNTSLFGDKEVIELHIKNKITDIGSKTLQNYANNPSPDKIVIIISNKLDGAQQRTAWYKSIDSKGVVLPIWPINQEQFPSWVATRLHNFGFKTDQAGIRLLVEHTSGNLLATIQEIEKLKLLYNSGNLTAKQIGTAIADNARFNVFNLIDAAMNNQTAAVNRILDNLERENVEPTIILWAITNELRSLIKISTDINQGVNIEQAMTQNGVWYSRKQLVKNSLKKHSLSQLKNLLKHIINVELIIKGADTQHLLRHEIKKIYLSFTDKNYNLKPQ